VHSESIDSVRTAADTKPLLGRRWGRPGAARFLVMCWYEPHGITTVYENIAMWQRLSEFELEILNLWPTRGHPLVLPPTIDLSEFDGVIIHAALSYSFENLNALDSQLGRPFEHYDGIKVLMKQDEQRATSLFAEYLGRKQFDVLLTCVPELELFRVYPRDKVGDLAFVNVLTGYVSQAMREMSNPWSRSRPIDIGYRGSIQPLCFGRLGFEKRKIGYDVLAALSGRDAIRSDISSRPQDRFNGSAWMDFISASKATLGVESGSNLFDFDGAVEEWCHGFEASHLEMNALSEELYNLAHAEYLWKLEGNVDYAQVSPRHFEAGAARSLQVLYDGRYSDIFVPGAHFLPLARDLSNLPEIVETLNDERKCREITERCFAEIIHNPSYGYEAFVAKVDAALESALKRKRGARRLSTAPAGDPPRCLILTTADPAEDPRLGRITAALALEHEGDAVALRHGAAMLVEGGANLRGAAVAIVGERFHDDGDAARPIALVAHFLVIGRILAAGAALDRTLDGIPRHIGGARRGQGGTKAGIHVGIGQAGARRGGQFADQLGEDLGALRVLRALAMHDVLELGMTGHRNGPRISNKALASVSGGQRPSRGYR